MKIALVNPEGTQFGRFELFQQIWKDDISLNAIKEVSSGISSALPIIAALTPGEFEVVIIDENIEQIDFDIHYDIVGITAMTQQATRAYELSEIFRKKGSTTVIGGIHATVVPEEASMYFDSVVVGEAEYIWRDLLQDYLNGKLKKKYQSSQSIDMGTIPLPRYDLLKLDRYHQIWIQRSRGCPLDCEFCVASRVYGLKVRTKSNQQLIQEIVRIKELSKKNLRIAFADDNFFVIKKGLLDLLDNFKQMKIRWVAQSDISIAEKDEILNKLHSSGCVTLLIGFESLSEENLNTINKNKWKAAKIGKYSESIQKIQKLGIGVHGAFILGFDHDDKESFKKVSDFILENNLYYSQITILTPLPGTKMRKRLESDKRLIDTSWDNYTFFDVNFRHPKLSKSEIEEGIVSIYKTIYSKEVELSKMKYFKNIHKAIRLNSNDE